MVDKSKIIREFLQSGEENIGKVLSKLRGNGGGTKALGMVEEAAENLPAIRANTIPKVNALAGEVVEETPLMLRKTLPDISTTATEVGEQLALPPGGVANVVNDAIPGVRNNSLVKKAMIGTGIAGLGAVALDGMDGGEPPVNTSVPADILSNANRQPVNPKAVQQTIKTQAAIAKAAPKKTLEDEVVKVQEKLETNIQKDEDNFQKKLEEARQSDNDRNMLFGLLRAAQQGGSALANSKADTTFADNALADANKYVNQLEKNQKLTEENKEAKDVDIQRDPNSDISRQAREIARKVGLNVGDNISAQQLKAAGLPIGNLLTQKMAIDARKETAQLQRETNNLIREEKKTAADEKQTASERNRLDKMVSTLIKSDDFKGYQGAVAAKAALDNALQKGDKTSVGSAFMIYAKIAQGDNSVVRESDMKNLAGTYNYTNAEEMLDKLSAKARGGNFTPGELQQMRAVADLIEKVKAKHVQAQLKPIRSSIDKYGIEAAEVIDPNILNQFEENAAPPAADLTTISRAPSAQGPVTIRNKATGTTKVLDAARAAKYMNDPAFEVIP